MITLETALAAYQSRCERSTIATYPMMWAGHYNEAMLGEIGIPAPITDLAQLSLTIMAPFSFCEAVTSSTLFVDGAAVSPYSRVLFGIQLNEMKSGHMMLTPWEIEYQLTDTGTIYSTPVKDFFRAPTLYRAMNEVFDRRRTADKFTFDEAYVASIKQLNELV